MTSHPPTLHRTLHHLRRPLAPLVSITTGAPHPSFPPTLLHYHLLTAAQLDALAHYYHQRTPSEHSFGYPLPVLGRWHAAPSSACMAHERALLEAMKPVLGDGIARDENRTEAKRRRFGRFCGLRGCESPGMGEGDEELMGRAMEAWVRGAWRRGEERDVKAGVGRGKGCW